MMSTHLHPGKKGLIAPDYVVWLREAIKQARGCQGVHHSTRAVRIFTGNHVDWQGEVEIFDLFNHPRADRCFAWGHVIDGEFRAICVLALPPVSTPEEAVRLALTSGMATYATPVAY